MHRKLYIFTASGRHEPRARSVEPEHRARVSIGGHAAPAAREDAHRPWRGSQEITMERQIALQIVQALAQGIDPHTGEQFSAESPYQHPDTVRALVQAAEALGVPASLPRSKASHPGIPENAGKPWTEPEDQALAEAFDAGMAIPQLAEQHRRTRAAIQARLIRMGKLEPTDGPRFAIKPPAPVQAMQ